MLTKKDTKNEKELICAHFYRRHFKWYLLYNYYSLWELFEHTLLNDITSWVSISFENIIHDSLVNIKHRHKMFYYTSVYMRVWYSITSFKKFSLFCFLHKSIAIEFVWFSCSLSKQPFNDGFSVMQFLLISVDFYDIETLKRFMNFDLNTF